MNHFIEEYPNALGNLECDSIISWFENNKKLHKSGEIGTGFVNKNNKVSTDIPMNFLYQPENLNLIIFNAIANNIQKYRKTYPEIDEYVHPWVLRPDWNIQKYLPKEGYFATHCETTCKENSYRVMAWMIYLNSVTDGGGTHFPQYSKTVTAEQGKLVIWPSYWTHLHHGVCSQTETKYIATGWFSFN